MASTRILADGDPAMPQDIDEMTKDIDQINAELNAAMNYADSDSAQLEADGGHKEFDMKENVTESMVNGAHSTMEEIDEKDFQTDIRMDSPNTADPVVEDLLSSILDRVVGGDLRESSEPDDFDGDVIRSPRGPRSRKAKKKVLRDDDSDGSNWSDRPLADILADVAPKKVKRGRPRPSRKPMRHRREKVVRSPSPSPVEEVDYYLSDLYVSRALELAAEQPDDVELLGAAQTLEEMFDILACGDRLITGVERRENRLFYDSDYGMDTWRDWSPVEDYNWPTGRRVYTPIHIKFSQEEIDRYSRIARESEVFSVIDEPSRIWTMVPLPYIPLRKRQPRQPPKKRKEIDIKNKATKSHAKRSYTAHIKDIKEEPMDDYFLADVKPAVSRKLTRGTRRTSRVRPPSSADEPEQDSFEEYDDDDDWREERDYAPKPKRGRGARGRGRGGSRGRAARQPSIGAGIEAIIDEASPPPETARQKSTKKQVRELSAQLKKKEKEATAATRNANKWKERCLKAEQELNSMKKDYNKVMGRVEATMPRGRRKAASIARARIPYGQLMGSDDDSDMEPRDPDYQYEQQDDDIIVVHDDRRGRARGIPARGIPARGRMLAARRGRGMPVPPGYNPLGYSRVPARGGRPVPARMMTRGGMRFRGRGMPPSMYGRHDMAARNAVNQATASVRYTLERTRAALGGRMTSILDEDLPRIIGVSSPGSRGRGVPSAARGGRGYQLPPAMTYRRGVGVVPARGRGMNMPVGRAVPALRGITRGGVAPRGATVAARGGVPPRPANAAATSTGAAASQKTVEVGGEQDSSAAIPIVGGNQSAAQTQQQKPSSDTSPTKVTMASNVMAMFKPKVLDSKSGATRGTTTTNSLQLPRQTNGIPEQGGGQGGNNTSDILGAALRSAIDTDHGSSSTTNTATAAQANTQQQQGGNEWDGRVKRPQANKAPGQQLNMGTAGFLDDTDLGLDLRTQQQASAGVGGAAGHGNEADWAAAQRAELHTPTPGPSDVMPQQHTDQWVDLPGNTRIYPNLSSLHGDAEKDVVAVEEAAAAGGRLMFRRFSAGRDNKLFLTCSCGRVMVRERQVGNAQPGSWKAGQVRYEHPSGHASNECSLYELGHIAAIEVNTVRNQLQRLGSYREADAASMLQRIVTNVADYFSLRPQEIWKFSSCFDPSAAGGKRPAPAAAAPPKKRPRQGR